MDDKKKKNLEIKLFYNDQDKIDLIKKVFLDINFYFNFNIEYIFNFDKNIDDLKKIIIEDDFCFVYYSDKFKNLFSWNFYSSIHETNKKFKLIFLLENYSDIDFMLFKNGIDDIIYLNRDYQYIKWKILSLLRRRWSDSHTKHILIHNGVIIDLIKRKVIVNNKDVNITKKEFELLTILVQNFNDTNELISKTKIYNEIYKDKKNDVSRIIDQLVFRLKQKLGKDFIVSKKNSIKIL